MNKSFARRLHGNGECWYCGERPNRTPGSRRRRTREHLVALNRGGDSHWRNIRYACLDCNELAGDWNLDQKVRLRSLLRARGWEAVAEEVAHPRKGWRFRLLSLLATIPEPADIATRDALDLAAAYAARRNWNKPSEQQEQTTVRPVIDGGEWLMAVGRLPMAKQVSDEGWLFTIGDQRERIDLRFYRAARRRAVELAKSRGVEKIVLHAPAHAAAKWCSRAATGSG